jgi:lipase
MTTREIQKHQVAGLTVTEWPGSGQVVFGLPGLGGSGSTWSALAEDLPGARVLSFDMRGRGEGHAMTGPTGLRAHAKDVAAILTELDLRDVVVVGHSMGAFLAPLVAQEAPDRVAKLVLVDGGIRPAMPFFMGPALTRLAFSKQMKSLDKPWPNIEALAKKAKFDKVIGKREDLRERILRMFEQEMDHSGGTLRPRTDIKRCAEDAADCFFGPDVTTGLAALTVPAEVFLAENLKWDGQRQFITDKQVVPWTAKLPHLKVKRLPGNHVTVLFAPEVAAACTLQPQS